MESTKKEFSKIYYGYLTSLLYFDRYPYLKMDDYRLLKNYYREGMKIYKRKGFREILNKAKVDNNPQLLFEYLEQYKISNKKIKYGHSKNES